MHVAPTDGALGQRGQGWDGGGSDADAGRGRLGVAACRLLILRRSCVGGGAARAAGSVPWLAAARRLIRWLYLAQRYCPTQEQSSAMPGQIPSAGLKRR